MTKILTRMMYFNQALNSGLNIVTSESCKNSRGVLEYSATQMASFFAVEPKLDCPHGHRVPTSAQALSLKRAQSILSSPCGQCKERTENWVCLECLCVFCSRYVRKHMVKHSAETGHLIAFSFSDCSVWCYGCDSYIIHSTAQKAREMLYLAKFGELPPNNSGLRVVSEEICEPSGAENWVECGSKNSKAEIEEETCRISSIYPDPNPLPSEELPNIPVEKQLQAVSHTSNSCIKEYADTADVLKEKVKELASLLRGANHVVAYTGAGVSLAFLV